MSSDHLATFESSLQGTATVHRTTADQFAETLAEAIETPAVGSPLPYDGVSLTETPVETEFAPTDLEAATTGVTPVDVGIATYGTVTVPSASDRAELVSLYTSRHVAVIAASDIVADMPEGYEALTERFEDGRDTQVLATGPSATADMGTLIEGVHGPSETHVVVLEDR